MAILITNQVISDPSGGAMFVVDPKKPVGGHVMAHASTIRLSVRKGKAEQRLCKVVDSPNLPEGEASYAIGVTGIEDYKCDERDKGRKRRGIGNLGTLRGGKGHHVCVFLIMQHSYNPVVLPDRFSCRCLPPPYSLKDLPFLLPLSFLACIAGIKPTLSRFECDRTEGHGMPSNVDFRTAFFRFFFLPVSHPLLAF